MPEHKALRRSVLGVKRRLQSAGAQRVICVEKDKVLAVRCSQSGVARGGHAAVLLMQNRHTEKRTAGGSTLSVDCGRDFDFASADIWRAEEEEKR